METYLGTEGQSAGKRRDKEEDLRSPPGTAGEGIEAQAAPGGAAGAITSPSPAPRKIIGAGIRADLISESSKTGGSTTNRLQPKKEEETFEIPKVGDHLLRTPKSF
jgi:hypothetical protein